MNMKELTKLLKKAHVPNCDYNFTGTGRTDERINLIKNGDEWEVFFVERGVKTTDEFFDTEDEACQYIYEELVD